MVAFEQITPLGDLTIRWTGPDEGEITIVDEFEGTPVAETPAAESDDSAARVGADGLSSVDDAQSLDVGRDGVSGSPKSLNDDVSDDENDQQGSVDE